ncbi:MAG: hypothetical protein R2856_01780 [Caldilineaceae bacterium]
MRSGAGLPGGRIGRPRCLAMPAVPVLLAVMAGIGLAIHLTAFTPTPCAGGVMGVGFVRWGGAGLPGVQLLFGRRRCGGVGRGDWGQGEAQATLAQGRAFLTTLATWSLWLILPLGYLSLLAQVAGASVGGRRRRGRLRR